MSWDSVELDRRVREAVRRMGLEAPTLVQAQTLPPALQLQDVLLQAPTGSGKTLAYVLPTLHNLLAKTSPPLDAARALVLVPTRELSAQVAQVFREAMYFCSNDLTVVELSSGDSSFASEKLRLSENPSIIISTPARVAKHLKSGIPKLLSHLEVLVVDEADLILSYGYEDDLKTLIQAIPSSRQTLMMSATLNAEVDSLKKLVLQKPVILKLKDSAKENQQNSNLSHYYIELPKDNDKEPFLYVLSLLKLGVVFGKTLFFVNDIDRCFRLKLFLEVFGVNCAVLNSELPANSRLSIVDQFNKGIFDYLIATDKGLGVDTVNVKASLTSEDQDDDDDVVDEEDEKKHLEEDDDVDQFGVARGIDFKFVSNVINFDFPSNLKSYIHRVGRTARGGHKGTAISFVTEDDEVVVDKVKLFYGFQGEEGFRRLSLLKSAVDGLRYRSEDVIRGITRLAVKEARLSEVRKEMLASDKLKAHFEDNPREKELLKHDRALRPRAVQEHLKSLPQYLLPSTAIAPVSHAAFTVSSGLRKRGHNKRRRKAADPLSSIPMAGDMKRRAKHWVATKKHRQS